MDEKEKTQEIQEATKGKTEEASTESILEKTEKVVEQDKENLDRREELIRREEEILSRKQLGGTAEAGKPAESKEETPQEYAEKILRNQQ